MQLRTFMKCHLRLSTAFAFGLLSVALASAQILPSSPDTLPPGTVLRIEVDHRTRIKQGKRVFGHITEPIYLHDHLLVPAGSKVSGFVQGSLPAAKGLRTEMLLAGDFSKPHLPNVIFNELAVPAANGQPSQLITVRASTVVRNAAIVKIGGSSKRVGLVGKARQAISAQRDSYRL